jgi:type III restriction enzyme
LTVEVIEKSLIEDHHIPADQIVRATGETKGLEGVDLSDEKCEIRYIITVQALREGWDCPFAYILCSVAEQRAMVLSSKSLAVSCVYPIVSRERTKT